jgi:hypothetical protein
VLAPPPPGRAKASQSKRKFMETMERVDEIAASQQFKPLDEVARNLLLQRFGAKFDLRGLGILGIPIGTEPDAKGSSIGGCLFALVYGPNLTVKQLDDLAVYEILFLKSHPLKATHSVHAAEAPRDAKEELIQARKLAGLPSLRAPKRKKAAKA